MIETRRLGPKNGICPLKIREWVRYNEATRIMTRPRSRAAQQKEERHMKKWMALLLCCLLCWCAAGAMAEGAAEIVLSHFDSWTYDIYPNGYTKTNSSTTEFIEYEGPYVIKGDSGPKDTPLEFHANAYDEATGKVKTENGQTVSYAVTFDNLELIPNSYCTAVRFGCDEGHATGCSITLKLRLSGTSEIWTYGHPPFQYSFGEEGNTVRICVHNSSGTLTLGAGNSSEWLVGRNITLYANGKTITNTSAENQSEMPIDATISSPTNLNWVDNSPATCETDGSIAHWECPRCGAPFTDEEGLIDTTLSAVTIPSPGHDLKKVPAKAPTCTEDGNVEYWACIATGCGKLFSDAAGQSETTLAGVTLSALKHDLKKVEAKAPTCTEDGHIEYYQCTREGCGRLFSDAAGQNELTAADVILPAAHDLKKVEAKEPTYAQDGSIEHWVCTRCGKLFADVNGTQELSADDVILPMLVRTDTLPQTGDSSCLTGWLALLGACCAGLLCLTRRRG